MSLKSLLKYMWIPGDSNSALLVLVFFGVFVVVFFPLVYLVDILFGKTQDWAVIFLIPAISLGLFAMLKVNKWLDAHAW